MIKTLEDRLAERKAEYDKLILEAEKLLNQLEDVLNKQNYTIFDTGIEREP